MPRSTAKHPSPPSARASALAACYAAWGDAVGAAETAEQALTLTLAGSVALSGAARAFVLRPERRSGEKQLVGWLAVDAESVAREPSVSAWRALAAAGGADAVAPELTSRLRSLRLSFEGRDDVTLASWRAATPATSGGATAAHPVWEERLGVVSFHALPVLSEEGPEAVIVLPCGETTEPPPLALALVAQCGRALARLRAAADARLRRGQLATLRETARAAGEAQTLPAGLQRVTRSAAQALGARGAALWLTDAAGRTLTLSAIFGDPDESETRARALELAPLAEACVFHRETPLVAESTDDPRLGAAARRLAPLMGVPLLARDRMRGALVLFGREEEPALPFTREEQDLLALFAALASSLVEQAGLAERVSAAEKKLEEARGLARRAEGLAHLGEVSVRMAREMSGPAASILGFARRVHRSLPEGDPAREYLEIVSREAERLERLVSEHLQFAALHRFHLGLTSLNHVVQDCLERVSSTVATKRVRLLKKLSADVPPLVLDEEKISQAIANALGNALESVSSGGCVRIETRFERGQAVIEVAHDGPPPAGELLDHLFVPFATGGRGSQGLGLAVAQRIVRDHGGEVGVRREGDWGQVLTLTLPVRDNEDRRHGRDRRGERGDRRNRMAEV